MSAFNADVLMASPSWKSMARTVLLSRRVLNSPFGSLSWAPFGNVSLTAFLRASPMQTMPSWDQTGTPSGREGFFHFTSSITPGSAPLMRARSWLSLSPLQPAVRRTMSSTCWDAMRRSCRRFAAPAQHPADRRAQLLVLAVDAAKPTTRPPLPLQQLGLQSLDVLAPRFCFLRPEHPADPLVACKRSEVFPRRENLRLGRHDASQIHRHRVYHSAGYRLGPHRPLILARQLRALGTPIHPATPRSWITMGTRLGYRKSLRAPRRPVMRREVSLRGVSDGSAW